MINGYPVNLWGLFFHLHTQSKYVLELDKEADSSSFINPLAEEIVNIFGKILSGDVQLSCGEISHNDRVRIADYIGNEISPVIKCRSLSPSLLLLASIETLYLLWFKPIIDVLGESYVKEFIEDFSNRVINLPKTSTAPYQYDDTMKLVDFLVNPYRESMYVINKITKYKEMFKDVLDSSYGKDPAHGMDHIDSVLKKAIRLNYKYNAGCDIDEIIVASLLHDMFSASSREHHHELGYEWVIASRRRYQDVFEDVEVKIRIARAILEHRASYSGDYYSNLSELLATADREDPNLNSIVSRAFKYYKHNNPDANFKEVSTNVLKHLEEKYSRRGYSQYTNMYMLENNKELHNMLDDIDSLMDGTMKLQYYKSSDSSTDMRVRR